MASGCQWQVASDKLYAVAILLGELINRYIIKSVISNFEGRNNPDYEILIKILSQEKVYDQHAC